jgi:hypothetical protein
MLKPDAMKGMGNQNHESKYGKAQKLTRNLGCNAVMIEVAAGGMAGLIFGSLAAFLNYRISKSYMERSRNGSGKNGIVSVMGVSFARMLINAVALAVVFFLRDLLPWPFAAVVIGTSLGLSAVSILLILHLSRCHKQN